MLPSTCTYGSDCKERIFPNCQVDFHCVQNAAADDDCCQLGALLEYNIVASDIEDLLLLDFSFSFFFFKIKVILYHIETSIYD